MIGIDISYAVIDLDRAAASVRPLLAAPAVWLSGLGVCPQHAERFAGMPATPTTSTSARRRPSGTGYVPATKINKFAFQPDMGSTVWRPPV